MAIKSLEIRINSASDAKSVVRTMNKIRDDVKEQGLDSIEFLVALEVVKEVRPLIHGLFKIKTNTSYVSPRPGNVLYELPHYPQPTPLVMQVQPTPNPVVIEQVAVKPFVRRGRPPKAQAAQASA